MSNIYGWDVEVATWPESGEVDWADPPDISCGAVAFQEASVAAFGAISGKPDDPLYEMWIGDPILTKGQLEQMASYLIARIENGSVVATWNGASFDFPLLLALLDKHGSHIVANKLRVAARKHVDLMFMVVAQHGHFLGFDAALKGAQIGSKLHQVRLSDGTTLNEMSGALAPKLWQQGERQAVIDYLKVDCEQTLHLTAAVAARSEIRWYSKRGRLNIYKYPDGIMTVDQCLRMERQVASWVTNPKNPWKIAERLLESRGC